MVNIMTKLMSITQAAAVIFFCAATPAGAQAQAVSDELAAAAPFSSGALDQLLQPIALYPDPLLADLFTAATVPEQIVMADRYVSGGGDLSQIAAQPWDPGVQALAHYPAVLQWLDENLPWTTEVGQAFLNQQPEVMASIQRLRLLAQSEGNLQSTPQEDVVSDGGTIEIEPANPDEIYVPAYPWNTIYSNPGVFCSFGAGFPAGIWLTHDWDWRNHRVITWGPGHSRPANWWSQPSRNRVAPSGVPTWHGLARASAGAARSPDRGFFAPQTFRPAPLTAPSAPATLTVNRSTTPTRAAGSVPSVNFSVGARSSFGVASGGFAVAPMTGRPPPVVIPSTGASPSFAVGSAPTLPRSTAGSVPSGGNTFGSGAFGGSESSSEARQGSVRGVESRGAISAPSAAPSSSSSRSSATSSATSSASSSSSRSAAPSSAPASRPSQSSSSGSSRGR